MNYFWGALFWVFCIANVSVAENTVQIVDSEWLDRAESFYRQGQYAEAAFNYEKLWLEGKQTAGIAYNIALAHYRAGNSGKAVAAAMAAYRLSPRDPDLSKLVHALPFDVSKFISGAYSSWYAWLFVLFDAVSMVEIFHAGLLLFALGLTFITAAFWLPWNRRWQLFTPGLCITLLAAMAVPLLLSLNRSLAEWGAITESRATIYSEPESKQHLELFSVAKNTPARELMRAKDWVRVQFADGRQGWISAASLARY